MSEADGHVILLLEDQHLVRAGLSALIQLSEPRAHIIEASSYEEAISRLEEHRVDLAFLDIDLKGELGGVDVLKHIRRLEMDTRAVMLSATDDKAVVMDAINEGASGYILKDMESDGLFRRALDTVFGGGIFLPASVMGRGGFTPSLSVTPLAVSAESLGIHGRPLEVLYYVCQGLPNKAIARKMGLEEGTVRRDYMPRLFRIFKVARRTEILVEVSRRGIKVTPPASAEA